jgi:uncharacterized protein DUF6894
MPMPRYYFNIDGLPSDPEGTVMSDVVTAKCEAVKLAGRYICDAAGDFWDTQDWGLTVTDEIGLTLFSLRFMGMEAPSLRQPGSSHAAPL